MKIIFLKFLSIYHNFIAILFSGEIEDEDLKSLELINLPDDENHFTPLHWACYYGQLKTAEKLLKYRANPNALAKNYVSPLHLAGTCQFFMVLNYF
jgi:ankyrin repeat protein